MIADVPLDGGHSCHDIGVLLSKRTKLAACAGMEGIVFDIDDLDEPERLNSFTYPGVTSWHSAMLSKDGSVTAMGWEPGGGVGPECEAGDPDFFKSIFFYDTESGELLGTWVLPRAQSAQENCTIHNYNVIPTRHARPARGRRLPGGDLRGRLHRPGASEDRRLVTTRRRSIRPR